MQPDSAEDTTPPTEPDEQRDGPVAPTEIDTADGESPEATDANEPQIDAASLEALLFSTHHPLTAGRLGELLGAKSAKAVRQAIRELNRQYEEASRSFRIEQVAGGFQMLTLPGFAAIIKKHQQKEADAKLTKAALETLAIIGYKQPILRADIEAIRGVACGETVRSLMEKHLVKIAGRAEEPGRPILYGTTKRFLEIFGLNSLKDLPKAEDELKAKAAQIAEAKASEPAPAELEPEPEPEPKTEAAPSAE